MQVTSYRSAPAAFYVNSHLIDLPNSVVVVDTQFILPEVENVVQAVRQSGKPLMAVFLTHPHPDHVNGTAVLLREWPQAKVYATQATTTAIAELAEPKRQQWKPLLGDAYPDSVVLPSEPLESGATVTLDGVAFRFEDIGAMESINETIITVEGQNVLFAGDLIYNKVHPWLVEGRSHQWREKLATLLPHLSDGVTLYVGHGDPAGKSDVIAQIDYIDFFTGLLHDNTDSPILSEEGRQQIIAVTRQRYPNWPLEMLIPMNIDGVMGELHPA